MSRIHLYISIFDAQTFTRKKLVQQHYLYYVNVSIRMHTIPSNNFAKFNQSKAILSNLSVWLCVQCNML